MNRPKRDSQAGKILALLESAHTCGRQYECSNTLCGRVSLPLILNLRISQYGARIHDLRHGFGFVIENGPQLGSPDHTWFRLAGRRSDLIKKLQPASHIGKATVLIPLFGDLAPDRSYAE